MHVGSRSLVLGGGGLLGVAWLVGVVTGLAEAGIDLLHDDAPDTIVGTSAGSIVGAHLADRTPLARQRELALDDETAQIATVAMGKLDIDVLLEGFALWASLPDASPASLARLGELARRAPTVDEATYVTAIGHAAGGHSWPSERFACVAVDTVTGEHVTFHAGSGAPLDRAVAASCAVPGVFPTVEVCGHRCTDGGIRSGTNADLVRGTRHALILAPMGSYAGDPLDATAKASLDAEVAQLGSDGTQVVTLLPDDAANAATLVSPLGRMDPESRRPALDHGIRQGRALADRLGAW